MNRIASSASKIYRWAVVAFILVIALAMAAPVQAHAMLLRSSPTENGSLALPPTKVELFFSEATANNLSSIKVMDSTGKRVDSGHAQVDPADATHLVVSLGPLSDGVYIVVWNVISVADGHQTSGTFPFAVGKVDANALAMGSAQMAPPIPPTPLADMIVKGFLFIAATALMGGIMFKFLVWNPSYLKAHIKPEDLSAYETFSTKLMLTALVLLGAADVLGLMLLAGHASGVLVALPWSPEFVSLLATRIGLVGVSRLVLALILARLLLPHQKSQNLLAGLVCCLLLLLTFSLESHAAGETNPLLPITVDWIHMVAMSVWVGGLFSFLGGMWLIRKLDCEASTRLTAFLIPHFTILAMTSVAFLTLTGIYSSVLHVGSIASLVNTNYGQALILKLLIAAPMIAMGGINYLFTTPSMHRAAAQPGGNPALVNRFRYLLTVETSLGVMALIWVGVFTTLPPANMQTAPMMGFSQSTKVDDLRIILAIDPARSGINTFTATITSGAGPVTNTKDVFLEFISTSGSVPPSKAAMISQGNGIYSLQGGYLAMPDKWDIKVVVIRPGKFDAYGDFTIDLSQAAGQRPSMP